jgi:hypothetical protein
MASPRIKETLKEAAQAPGSTRDVFGSQPGVERQAIGWRRPAALDLDY